MKPRLLSLLFLLVLVLGAAGFALWKLPFAGGEGRDEASATNGDAAFCAEHQIPEADCPWCRPGLLVEAGFCGGHGVPEALCVRCDARLEAGFRVERDWCQEHGLPESQCLRCGAVLPDPPAGQGAAAPRSETGFVPPFATVLAAPDTPRAQRAPDPACATAGLLVQLRSVADVRAAGIELSSVEQREAALELERNAVLDFDGDRHALLGSRAPGTVAEVLIDLGQEVAAGEALLVVDSPAVGEAKAALLRERARVEIGRRDHEREAKLLEQGAGTARQALEAETRLVEAEIALAGARQRLRSFGLDEAAIERVCAEGEASSLLPLRAPFPGTVVERSAALGQTVLSGETLLELADLGRMWSRIDLREEDAAQIALGMPVELRVDALPGSRWKAELDWIGAALDPRSRTLPARAVVENPGGRLRAGMFGRVRIQVRDRGPLVLVSKQAVQWEGCCNVVFVPEGPAAFRPRPVQLGPALGDQYVVEQGLDAGEQVVTTGAFLLKTEILKGSIGAGCCADEATGR